MVPEIMIGSSKPRSAKIFCAAKMPALVLSVSVIVSNSSRSAPPSISPLICFGIGVGDLVERDVAGARIIDVRRHRGGLVERPEGAGNEAALAVLVLRKLRGLTRQPGAGRVHLVGELLHAVVGHDDRGRRERIGLADVGAGEEILQMDGADGVRLRQHQQVVVAAHVLVPVLEPLAAIVGLRQFELLDHRPHRAVEHEDAFLGSRGERCAGVVVGRKRLHRMILSRANRAETLRTGI